MKKFILSFMTIFLLAQASFALDGYTPINLDNLVKETNTNSKMYKVALSKLALAEKQSIYADKKATEVVLGSWSSTTDRIAKAKQIYLEPMKRQENLKYLKKTLTYNDKKLKLDILKAYTDYAKLINKNELSNMKLNYDIKFRDSVRLKLNSGLLTFSDVLSAENQLAVDKKTVLEIENNIQLSQMSINNLLWRAQDTAISKFNFGLDNNIDYNKIVINDEMIKNYIANDLQYYKLNMDMKNLEQELKLTRDYSVVSTDELVSTLDTYELDLEDIKYQITERKNSLEANFNKDIRQIESSRLNIALVEKQLIEGLNQKNEADQRYKLGLADKLSISLADMSFRELEIQLNESKMDYMLLLEAFYSAIH